MTKLIAPTDKAIVTLDKAEATHANGLIIPETVQERSTHATVVSSGIPDLNSGDRVVLTGPYAGASYDVDGVTYTTVILAEIIAVVG